jgi:hypothetical protein
MEGGFHVLWQEAGGKQRAAGSKYDGKSPVGQRPPENDQAVPIKRSASGGKFAAG